MYALRDLLGDALTVLIGARRVRQAAVLDAWPALVGHARARHARALGIRGRTLVVATDLPVLYHELGLRRAALIEALNREAGEQAIHEIQLVMRPLGVSREGEPGRAP